MLRRSCPIPEFPFSNRHDEVKAAEEFCLPSESGPCVLVVRGAAGVGKSRFVQEVGNRLASQGWSIVRAAPKGQMGSLSDAIGGVSAQVGDIVSSRSGKELTTVAKQTVDRLRRNLPSLASNSARVIPLAGPVIADAVKGAVEPKLRSSAVEMRWHAIRDLAGISRQISQRLRLLFLIDDLHEFDNAELDDIARFLAMLELDSAPNIRVVIATQQASDRLPRFDHWIDGMNQSGLLAVLELNPLDDSTLRSIVASTIENPTEAEPLIVRASGNPQVFLEQLLKLNAAGELHTNGPLLVLPENTPGNTLLAQSLWETISGTGIRRCLLGVLAMGRAALTVRDLASLATAMGTDQPSTLQHVAAELDREHILMWEKSDENDGQYALQFRHGLIRQQLRTAIFSGPFGDRLEFGHIGASVIQAELERSLPDPVSVVTTASDTAAPIATVSPIALTLLGELCDVLNAIAEPKHFAFTLGLIRIAAHYGRHDIVAQCAGWIEDELPAQLDPESPVYLRYAEMILDAHYQLGAFSKVIRDGERVMNASLAVGCLVAGALLILKDDENSTRKAVAFTDEALSAAEGSSAEPQIRLLNAVAYQEMGEQKTAAERYESFLQALPRNEPLTPAWADFLTASTLLVDDDRARALCTLVLDSDIGDLRREGKAFHNLGIAQIGLRDFDAARTSFQNSVDLLESGFAHETVFPSNSLAALDLLAGNAEGARSLLYGALFRTRSENYATTLRINLALATYMLGGGFDLEAYDRMAARSHIKEHIFLQWLVEYSRTFLILKSKSHPATEELIAELHNRMCRYDDVPVSRYYWNALVAEVCADETWEPIRFDGLSDVMPVATLDPSVSLVRPALLAFGRT